MNAGLFRPVPHVPLLENVVDFAVKASIATELALRIGSVVSAALYKACIAVEDDATAAIAVWDEATAVIAVEDDTTALSAVAFAITAAIAVWDAATAAIAVEDDATAVMSA